MDDPFCAHPLGILHILSIHFKEALLLDLESGSHRRIIGQAGGQYLDTGARLQVHGPTIAACLFMIGKTEH